MDALLGLALPVVILAMALASARAVGLLLAPAWAAVVRRRAALSRASLAVAALPWLAGGTVALAALLPGDPHLDQLFGCHCADSMPAWMHLCPVHPAQAAGLLPLALPALALLLPRPVAVLRHLLGAPPGRGTRTPDAPVVLDLAHPVVLLHGWWRPTLVADRGLWQALTPPERDAVLAHEQAHLARLDPQVLALLQLLLSAAPKGAADTIARAWLDRAELQADAAAAATVGDPAGVAAALVRCARLQHTLGGTSDAAPPAPRPALGWTGGALEQRVAALLAPQPAGPARARPDLGLPELALVLGASALALAASPWLHHQVEHLLNHPL